MRSTMSFYRSFASSSSTLRPIASRAFSSTAAKFDAAPSSIETALRTGLKTAMKSKDRPAIVVHKAVLADITNAAKSSPNPNDPLDEGAVINAIRKSIALRREAATQYAPSSPGAHAENHANLLSEIDVLSSYLPQGPSLDVLTQKVQSIIDSLSEEMRASEKVQGTVMQSLWDGLGVEGKAVDRKEVGRMVADMLKKLGK